MRSIKTFAPLVAFLTAVLLGVALMAPAAQAGTANKPKQQFSATDQRINNHKFIVSGKTTLTGKHFTVLKRKVHTKDYKYFSKPAASGKGTFKFTITGNLGDCFHVRLPSGGGYKATTINLGCIHRV